jgi:hypothetical protein
MDRGRYRDKVTITSHVADSPHTQDEDLDDNKIYRCEENEKELCAVREVYPVKRAQALLELDKRKIYELNKKKMCLCIAYCRPAWPKHWHF